MDVFKWRITNDVKHIGTNYRFVVSDAIQTNLWCFLAL